MAEANRDEAERCLTLCQRFFQEGEHRLALKYAEKSHRLFSSPQSLAWIERLRVAVAGEGEQVKRPSKPASKPDEPRRQTEQKKSNGPRDETGPAFSREQVEEVKRFQRVDKSDFYAVLGVQRGCDEVEVKKAYRKVRTKAAGSSRGSLTDFYLLPSYGTVGAAVSSG